MNVLVQIDSVWSELENEYILLFVMMFVSMRGNKEKDYKIKDQRSIIQGPLL